MRNYFKKTDAIDGKEGSEEDKKIYYKYYVKSGLFFESIFGSNTIDVKTTYTVKKWI
jgi:hypothetical protein